MKNCTIGQSGRQMIEIRGVLAIVGVLSVAGIAGYSKAMAKYKVNKLIDQISTIDANVRTKFAAQGNYKGLNGHTAYQLGIYPEEMGKDSLYENVGFAKSAIGGIEVKVNEDISKEVDPTKSDINYFDIFIYEIPRDACSLIAGTDWGADFFGFGPYYKLGYYVLKKDLADSGLGKALVDICSCPATKNDCVMRLVFG